MATHGALPEGRPVAKPTSTASRSSTTAASSDHREDWGNAPDVLRFVGRAEEVEMLRGWVVDERCRLLAVRGAGGIGKTTLAARLAQDVAPTFQRLYWRSMRDAPLTGRVARRSNCLSVGSAGCDTCWRSVAAPSAYRPFARPPKPVGPRQLRTLLEPGDRAGRYRDRCAPYGQLLRAIGEASHQLPRVGCPRAVYDRLAIRSATIHPRSRRAARDSPGSKRGQTAPSQKPPRVETAPATAAYQIRCVLFSGRTNLECDSKPVRRLMRSTNASVGPPSP